MFDDPSRAATDLAQWAEQMERKAERFQSLQARMAQLAVTTASSDKSVTVSVDANGVPTDIRFTDGIRRKSPAALAAELMQCLRQARETLVGDVAATVRDVVGDDPIGANIIKQYEDRYAAPEAPEPAAYAPPAAPDPIWSQQPAPQPPAPRPPTTPQPPTTPPPPTPSRPPASPEAAARPRPSTSPEPLPAPSSLIPDVDDEEGEYYRRASWLV
ncbi:YbaB/EbfC family nucleoid-associated protein [Nocardia sp. NBC_00416]|uniref:YbaB/EbfC family nucleoid-associated protein n=1 Tax=Nocardia sp. NBC_00416 TaxID=2975991 RepID=UPI002E1A59BD